MHPHINQSGLRLRSLPALSFDILAYILIFISILKIFDQWSLLLSSDFASSYLLLESPSK